jgi:hypothetical protein
MSSHAAFAFGDAASAFRKSAGTACKRSFLIMHLFYIGILLFSAMFYACRVTLVKVHRKMVHPHHAYAIKGRASFLSRYFYVC